MIQIPVIGADLQSVPVYTCKLQPKKLLFFCYIFLHFIGGTDCKSALSSAGNF